MYDSLIIYYFSGTGNAQAAATWISEQAKINGLAVQLQKIAPSLKVDKNNFSKNSLIGICYPTHGFCAPPVVVDFCLRFPRLNNKYFLLNTRAGMKISKLFTPGISGLAQLFPALILRIKGLKAVGFQPMDLPSNWISVHPGLKQKVLQSIFGRCRYKTREFAQKIIDGKTSWKGLLSLPVDLMVSPVSMLYFFFGRFFLAKSFIADSSCNSCGLCIKECPVQAIKWKKNRPFWTHKCESCMHCMNHCPKRAIQTPHSFIIPLWWFVMFVVPVSIARLISTPGDFISRNFDLFIWIILFVTAFPIIFGSYRLLHFFMQFNWFNWLVSHTSLTKFQFWRRYKAPKN